MDLNLLTVLEALVEEGSVGGAATRLRLSPPAVSRSLGRLRRLTGDDILVRTGRTMTRTPYALAVRGQVGGLLQQAGALLAPAGVLDLASVERVFTVRAHDALTALLAPALVGAVLAQAPGVQLRFLTESTHDTDDLRHGVVDLEFGSAVPTAPELRHEILGADPPVVVMRRGHLCTAGLDVSAYAAAPHVVVSRRGRLADPVDEALSTLGAHRTVVASVGTVVAAAVIVSGTETLLTAPGQVIGPVAAAFDLVTVPLPLDVPAPQVVSVWHRRSDSDPAHMWLRDRIRDAITSAVTPMASG